MEFIRESSAFSTSDEDNSSLSSSPVMLEKHKSWVPSSSLPANNAAQVILNDIKLRIFYFNKKISSHDLTQIFFAQLEEKLSQTKYADFFKPHQTRR